MFKRIFKPSGQLTLPMANPLLGPDQQALVEVLCSAASTMPFTTAEAKIAARYMSAKSFNLGDVVVREGDTTELDHILWILEGEATYESSVGGGASRPVTVLVVGVGVALGIMSAMDGEPRPFNAFASMPTRCALLTKPHMRRLFAEHPQVGIKLMSVMSMILSNSFRSLSNKLKCQVRLNDALRAELLGQGSGIFEFEDVPQTL